MRAVVLALTVALFPEFALDKTYVYKYEALLLGGLPHEGLARAGINLSSKVLLSAVTENTFLMKLMDPLLHEYAGIWPKDPFVPATKLTSALAAQLQIPIKFEYANGLQLHHETSCHRSTIAEATVEEVHHFSPFNEIHGAAMMEAKYD
uniref:Vitellogenin domain-containing protein n=1 Tax=Cyprinus carpio carpio TaxID=630221 RepID=A0A8C1A9R0_CYPCA